MHRDVCSSLLPFSFGHTEVYQARPAVFPATVTVPLVEGADAFTFGTIFFGFLVSRLPRFFSLAMSRDLSLLWKG